MQALVKDSPGKPAARQAEWKKPGNNNLPDGVDQKLWRRVFISTYMQYVAMWEAVHRWAGIPMFYEHHAITSEHSLHSPE